MAITDQHGNKIPQPKVKKKDTSRAIRMLRMQDGNPRFCGECGFRIRGGNHTSGKHHQEAPKTDN